MMLNQLKKKLGNPNTATWGEGKGCPETLVLIYGKPEHTERFLKEFMKLNKGSNEATYREWRLFGFSTHTDIQKEFSNLLVSTALQNTQNYTNRIPSTIYSYVNILLNKIGYHRIPLENYTFPEIKHGKFLCEPYVFPIANQHKVVAESLFKNYEN